MAMGGRMKQHGGGYINTLTATVHSLAGHANPQNLKLIVGGKRLLVSCSDPGDGPLNLALLLLFNLLLHP